MFELKNTVLPLAFEIIGGICKCCTHTLKTNVIISKKKKRIVSMRYNLMFLFVIVSELDVSAILNNNLSEYFILIAINVLVHFYQCVCVCV